MPRLFIAVDLTADIKDVLRGVQARPQFEGLRVRWAPPEQMHLTLVFLGATDARDVAPIEQAMSAAVAGRGPLHVSLGGLGAFPDLARPRVVWCGVEGDSGAVRKRSVGRRRAARSAVVRAAAECGQRLSAGSPAASPRYCAGDSTIVRTCSSDLAQ